MIGIGSKTCIWGILTFFLMSSVLSVEMVKLELIDAAVFDSAWGPVKYLVLLLSLLQFLSVSINLSSKMDSISSPSHLGELWTLY